MTKIVTVHSQQKWDYCFETRRTETSLLIVLNELGQQGWELVNTLFYKDLKGIMAWGAFLKRPNAGPAAPQDAHAAAAAIAPRAVSPSNGPALPKAQAISGFDLSGDEFRLANDSERHDTGPAGTPPPGH